MDTSKSHETAQKLDKELISFLAPVEKEAMAFFAKAPSLPKEIVEILVMLAPYFAILSVILMGIAILGMLGFSIIAIPFAFFAAPGGILYIFMTIVGWVLTLASIPGLLARSKTGWNFMFYGMLWSAVMHILSFNIVSLVLGLLITGYFLFQMRSSYLPKLPGMGQTSAKTHA